MTHSDLRQALRALLCCHLCAWALVLGLTAPRLALAQETPPESTSPALDTASTPREEAYRARIREALAEYDGGHYREALALFEQAYVLSRSARAQRGIALVQFELGLYAACMASIDAALQNPHDPLPEPLRLQLAEVRARALRFVGRLRVQVSPGSARVLVDGVPFEPHGEALPLTMGKHPVVVSAVGFRTEQRSAEIRGGAETTLLVVLEPAVDPAQELAQRKRTRRTWASLLAVSLAGTATTVSWMAVSAHDVRACRDGEALGATCTNETKLLRRTWAATATTAVGLSLTALSSVRLARTWHRPERLALGCSPDPKSLFCSASLRW